MLQISAAIQGGNSGGPLLDEFGNVVGIVTLKADLDFLLKKREIPQNINFAIKAAIAYGFLGANGVQPNLSASQEPLSHPTLAEQAKLFTVFIRCQ